MEPDTITKKIIHSAIKVHKALGPGLLESAYQKCLAYELIRDGMKTLCEVSIPIKYGEIEIDTGFRADMIIEDCIIIENKVVDKILPIHEAQLLTYLKLTDFNLGFLFNWNVTLMKHGIKRMVNKLVEHPPVRTNTKSYPPVRCTHSSTPKMQRCNIFHLLGEH